MPSLPDPMASFRLDGRVALVTGARREIGRAIATALAAQGAAVAVHHAGGAEEERDAAEAVGAIVAAGGTARGFAADFARDPAFRGWTTQRACLLVRLPLLQLLGWWNW